MARSAPVLVAVAALAGCGQAAPQDLSYVLVELEAVRGPNGTPTDALAVVQSTVAPETQLCVRLASPGSGTPASFVLYRAYGADPAPRVTLEVTPYSMLENDDTTDGSQFSCPSTFPPAMGPGQKLTFDFCAETSVAVTVNVGSVCSGCNAGTEVCGAGLSTDGAPCGATECCAMAITDACALVQVPTTTAMAP